jgi:hypothetical protein
VDSRRREPVRRVSTKLQLWRLRRWFDERLDSISVQLAERLFRRAAKLAFHPWRSERNPIPRPYVLDGVRIDVVGDLEAYTRLPRGQLEGELERRRDLSFRTEWHATPDRLRVDHWFYLSSKGYLFANASHFTDTSFVDRFVRPHLQPGARVLEFGGGAGNLSVALAGAGYEVWFMDLGALQRDFMRFRVERHGLHDRIHVIDWWESTPSRSLDAIIAVDAFEHVDALRETLDGTLLPALSPAGVLIENSSFVVNLSNPMHHEDYGFDEHLGRAGFELVEESSDRTRVWRGTRSAAE